ncbi:hypothetical protein GKE82_22865 [Conexibacter sp. W3-3-2]|uniref:hypothetical protein n=1 Tax=Conexibacter sp. W3-3-2 TaxID=2675227 RepID=UPI0012B85841|nr:hypothetical protein [Conexibacter sp. W3-3-2]MTD47051.1 hypothetical protein [Conexibacter sp. W3-3-2]
MSTPPLPPGTVRCPRCAAPVGPEQDWCLNCGAAARTRLAPTPNWRLPIAGLAAVVVVAVLALVVAFAALTDTDDGTVPGVTPTETAASTPPPGAAGGAPTTTPAVTAVTGATGVTGTPGAPGVTGPTGSSGLPPVATATPQADDGSGADSRTTTTDGDADSGGASGP